MFWKRVLLLGPHADDVEVSMGGTISKLVRSDCEIRVIVFSLSGLTKENGEAILKRECLASLATLGVQKKDVVFLDFKTRRFNESRQDILEILVKERHDFNPDCVFVPSFYDIHQDHKVVCWEGIRAFKHSTILGYEELWNKFFSKTNFFVKLEEIDIIRKIEAMNKYKSQIEIGRSYFSEDYIKSLARVQGQRIGCKYAEGFDALRVIF